MKLIIYSARDKSFNTSEKIEEQDIKVGILTFSTYQESDKR